MLRIFCALVEDCAFYGSALLSGYGSILSSGGCQSMHITLAFKLFDGRSKIRHEVANDVKVHQRVALHFMCDSAVRQTPLI